MATDAKGSASTYKPKKCSELAKNSLKPNQNIWNPKESNGKTTGQCLGWVKRNVECPDSGNVNNNVLDGVYSACSWAYWLLYWGFNIVCTGDTQTCPSGFQPMDGDIMVNAGSSNHPQGHVSIYHTEATDTGGHWASDYSSVGPGAYANGSFYAIFRK